MCVIDKNILKVFVSNSYTYLHRFRSFYISFQHLKKHATCITCTIFKDNYVKMDQVFLNNYCNPAKVVFAVFEKMRCNETFDGTNLDQIGDFNAQVDYILQNYRLNRRDVELFEDLRQDVEGVLQEKWPGTKIIPYGSIISGIGLQTSDIDLFVSLPKWAITTTPAYHLVAEVEKLLSSKKYKHLFKNVTGRNVYESKDNVPVVKIVHRKTRQHCDVSFNAIAVFDNRLITYLVHTDHRVLKLMFLIKLWGKILNFPSHLSCILRILVIFYFQQLDMLPPIHLLQKLSLKNDSVNGWDTSFEEPFYYYYSGKNISLYQLMGGFFQYYSNFNFNSYIVSAFAGQPLKRYLFDNVRTVPDIFSAYKRIVGSRDQLPLNITSEFCVPQFFVHNFNSGNKIDAHTAHRFIRNIRLGFNIFLETAERYFLKQLFVTKYYENNIETKVISCK